MDFAYRCYRCGKAIYGFQILYGSHCCTKCGSRRVEPLLQDLTWFGEWLLSNINKIGLYYYEKIKSCKSQTESD